MDDHEAIGIADGWIEPKNDKQFIEAWQHLHTTGIAYHLEGRFGRTAQRLLKAGIIT